LRRDHGSSSKGSYLTQKKYLSLLVAALLLLSGGKAPAILFGVDASTNTLLTIDTVTGKATAVGLLGFSAVNGLAYAPDDFIQKP
jgi:hypothetical protein